MSYESMDMLEAKWRLFLDGVELPFQSFTVSTRVDSMSTASVVLAPDVSATEFRPHAVLSVWFRKRVNRTEDRPDSPNDLLNNYLLYWEGLTTGYRFDKSPTTRMLSIEAEDMLTVLRRGYAFSIGVGIDQYSSVVSGASNLILETAGRDRDLASVALPSILLLSLTQLGEGRSPQQVFVDLISSLCSWNVSLRQSVVRYRLLDRIWVMEADNLANLIGQVVTGLMPQVVQDIQQTSSILDVVEYITRSVFYRLAQIPCPNHRELTEEEFFKADATNSEADKFNIKRQYTRNEYVFIQDTYFSAPPPCNLLFPNMIGSITVSRDYMAEPTRLITIDPVAALSNSYYVSPAALRLNLPGASLQTLEGLTAVGLRNTSGSAQSPYTSTINGTEINTLRSVLKEELEKGIVTQMGSYGSETLKAQVSAASDDPRTGRQTVTDLFLRVNDYMLQMRQQNRSLVVNSPVGLRYVVPGFPAAVFDKDISYIAVVDSVTMSVHQDSTESTTVTCSSARPLTYIDFEKITGLVNQTIPRASAAAAIKESQARQEAIQKVVYDLEQSLGLPLAPDFLSKTLTNPEALDTVFKDRLGCRELYTSKYREGIPALNSLDALDAALGGPTSFTNSLRFHVWVMAVLANIYPIPGRLGRPGTSAWDTIESGLTTVPVSRWVDQTFSVRSGTTMGQYLNANGLVLQTDTSDAPGSVSYYMQVPAEVQPGGSVSGTKTWSWDNTLFSKAVDDLALKSGGRDIDPNIQAVRAVRQNFILSTEYRQALVKTYSRKYFGSKGHLGK